MPAGKILDVGINISKIHAFAIGINRYQYKVASLYGCERDARAILKASAATEDNATLLLNEEATRKNILGILNQKIPSIKKNELFLFSISAHGAIVNNDLAIIPFDGDDRNFLGTALSTLYLITALKPIADKGGRVLIVLDICYSGALNFNLPKYSGALSEGGISALYACGPNEEAVEWDFGSGETQGVFTKYLIDGLNGESDTEKTGKVLLRDLYDYIYDNVRLIAPNQHPALIGTLEGDTVLKVL